MLVLRQTLLGGRRAGMATVAGITSGYLVWASASLGGLTALMAASPLAFDAVRHTGAVYLFWLGGRAIWKSLPRNRTATADPPGIDGPAQLSAATALRAGSVTNVLNPKVGVFYISLLPEFLPKGPGTTQWGLSSSSFTSR